MRKPIPQPYPFGSTKAVTLYQIVSGILRHGVYWLDDHRRAQFMAGFRGLTGGGAMANSYYRAGGAMSTAFDSVDEIQKVKGTEEARRMASDLYLRTGKAEQQQLEGL